MQNEVYVNKHTLYTLNKCSIIKRIRCIEHLIKMY